MIQSEQEYLLKNDFQVNAHQNYLNKAIFGLGCIGSLGCTAVQVLSITDVISTKNSRWILLAGAISFLGISIYGLARTYSLKKDETSSRFNNVEFPEQKTEKNIEIKKISKKLKEILLKYPEIVELQNLPISVTNENPVVQQLDAIQDFLEKTGTKIKELQQAKEEKGSLLEKISQINNIEQRLTKELKEAKEENGSLLEKISKFDVIEQKRLATELKEANKKSEVLEELQSLQVKMQIFSRHIGAVNELLGNEGTEIDLQKLDAIQDFFEKTGTKMKELKKTKEENGSLLEKLSQFNDIAQKRLVTELKEANEKSEALEELQTLQVKMQIFSRHIGAVNELLGNESMKTDLQKLEEIQDFFEKIEIKIKELTKGKEETEFLLKNESQVNASEQKRLKRKLEKANEKRELSEIELQSLQVKMQIFGGHIGTINELMGSEGNEISLENTQKVRTFITALMTVSADSDSSASSSASNSPFILLTNKNAHLSRLGNIPKFNING
ncbi:MAG: hypothetical protein H0W50_02010 [Parachlamydiaceae bacterium]|nr:hypothetical protein [Parachlamydiaceae bacterium]